MFRAQNALGLSVLMVASAATVGSLHAQTAWNSAAVTTADRFTTGTATATTWSDTAAWDSGTVADGAGLSVTLEPRHLTGVMTVTVDGTYTVGNLTSRTSNNNLLFTGAGKLIFDNNGSASVWNAHSRVTRFTNLRTDLFVDFQLNNALDIRFGTARSNETGVGRIGGVISGVGKLTLSLAQNDADVTRFHKIGNGATANTYSGGTEIRHVVNTAYGTGHGVGAATLLVNAVSTGAFGTGDVNLNSAGLNATAVTALTAATGGLQVQFSQNDVMGSTAVLSQTGNGAGTVFLQSTSQTIGGLVSTGTATEQDRKRVTSVAGTLNITTALAASNSYGGRIVGGTTVNIDGSGTQELTSTNSYSGATTISGGTLLVNGSLTASAVTVNGGILGGNATFGSDVLVNTGGTISAGNSIGSMTLSGGLDVQGAMNVEVDDVALADLYSVAGTLNLGANSALNVSVLNAITGTTYVFGNYGLLVGTFATVSSGWAVDYAYDNGISTNNLALIAVPEPGAIALSLVGGLLLFARRRR